MTIDDGFARPAHMGLGAVIPRGPSELSPQALAASRRRNMILLAIGLAAAVRLARDSGSGKRVIMVAIGLAAVAGLGREGLGGLAGWYKRQSQKH